MLNALAQAEADWQQRNAEYYEVGSARLYLALLKQEILWRSPDSGHRQDLEWQIVYDLATAGRQEASLSLVTLINKELNAQNSLAPDVTFLNTKGFTTELHPIMGLFGDDQLGWVLILGTQNPRPNSSVYSQAVFAIRHEASGFGVTSITHQWEGWHISQYQVRVEEHTNDAFPEIIVETERRAGTGPGFAGSQICIYQWNTSEWHSLLNTNDGKPCFAYGGYILPWEYLVSTENAPHKLDVTTWLNPGTWPFCDWTRHYVFAWHDTAYVLEDTWLDLPSQLRHPDELICVEQSWSEAIQTGDEGKLVVLMENVLTNWPEAVQLNDIVRDFLRYETEFEWVFRFQLGRYYALTGELTKAKSFLTEVAGQPLSDFKSPWPTRAQIYLENLVDVEQAERLLAEFNTSLLPQQTYPTWVDEEGVSRELANRLFNGDDPQVIITQLGALIAEYCTENRDCAQPYYVLGLAYEAVGDETNAVAAYWKVWHDYPSSYYALVAQSRLMVKE